MEDESDRRGKFFFKPDGRKPRVKSNIRAKFAHRGQHFGGQHPAPASSEEETFDGASSQLDLTPFDKETHEAQEVEDVNTEKREVNNNEAPSSKPAITNEIIETVETKPVAPQASHDLPLFPLQPVILNPRQSHRESVSSPKRPPLPPAILKHINHITDIRSLPPLPPLFRNKKFSKKVKKLVTTQTPVTEEEVKDENVPTTTSSVSDSLLQQLVIGDNAAQSPSVTSHSFSNISDQVPQVSTPSQTPVSGSNKLSAFRALQQQVKKRDLESSSQLTKDLV